MANKDTDTNTVLLSVRETADWLLERDRFLIITHRRPDGDTIGCAGALASGLREIGKTAYVLHNPETTERYAPYVSEFLAPDGFIPEEIITVDTASIGLFPENAAQYAGCVSLSIDHHPSNTGYAAFSCVDGTLAAGGEGVYDILIALSGGINEKSAACLYVALSTDTGCFAFGNTTANTLEIAAKTIRAGAPHSVINRKLFREKTKSRIKLEGLIYSSLEFFCGGAVAISAITLDMIKQTACTQDDLDDIASMPGSVEGVSVGITIRELTAPDDCKVSVRTSRQVNANELSQKFGGGGHPMAAGFSLKQTVDEIKRQVVSACAEIMNYEL